MPENLDKFLKLGMADHLFLLRVKDALFDADDYFKNEFDPVALPMVIKVAEFYPEFEDICLRATYNDFWGQLVPELMKLASPESDAILHFYPLPGVMNYQYLRGLYFYVLSLSNRNSEETVNSGEVEILEKAMESHSIHAMQRFHQYCYQEIEANPHEAEVLHRKIINNCRSMLASYGSYAYMMLAEAYYRYAAYCHDNNADPDKIDKLCRVAIVCCNFASEYLENSMAAIENASLGRGLVSSNTFGLDSPEAAKNLIQGWSRSLTLSESVQDAPVTEKLIRK